MGTIGRHYTKEFKEGAVALTYQPGMSIAQVAPDWGIAHSMLDRSRRAGADLTS